MVPLGLQIGAYVADLWTLVDTGAELSLLEGVHLRHAGVDIFSGRAMNFSGFLGAGMTAYFHPVRVTVADLQLELELPFSTGPVRREILGRDLLYYFRLELRERALEFQLAPDSN